MGKLKRLHRACYKISYHKIRNFRYFSLQWLQLRFYAEDCKSTIREIELEHQKTIQSLSRCSQSLYNEANAVLKNTHDLMIINGLLSERIQTLLKYATTSLEPEQESKLIEEITSAINHIKMENEQIAHHRQELEKAMRDIEQHDLEVAQKQELKDIQGHHFGGLSI